MQRRWIVAVLMCSLLGAIAANAASQEPAELVQARKEYDAKVEAATMPITERYLRGLARMERSFRARGKTEDADAVQREIDAVRKTEKGRLTKGESAVLGEWVWSDRITVTFTEDGRFAHGNVDGGKWEFDAREGTYTLSWDNGFIDTLIMSRNGKGLSGRNNKGTEVNVKRK